MAISKITSADTANKGVRGLPDVPGLTTEEMQRKMEELETDVIIPKVNEVVDAVNEANSKLETINDNFEWKLITSGVTGGTTVDISPYTDAKEFYVKCSTLTVLIPTAIGGSAFRDSYYATPTNYQYMNVDYVKGATITMSGYLVNGEDKLSSQKYNVYYR